MPRKISYGVDYDDGYDYDEDYPDESYDYNYNNGVDEPESGWDSPEIKPEVKKEIIRQNVWRCPICTYDNEDYMSSCDICGVLRNPLIRSSNNGQSSTVAPDLNKPSTSNAPSNKAINNGNSKSIAKPSAMSSSAKPSSVSAPLNSKDKFQHVEENNHASVSETQTHSLSSEMTSLTMSVKSDNSKIPDKAKVPRSHFKPENWMLPDQTKDSLTQLNLAIVGHVDSGKSTLSGRLLHLLGQISQKQMHKYEKEAKAQGKGSFAYAWAMDESAEERERGVTMTVAVAYFNSNKYHVVVLDSPGHRDFVPNLISGATQADAAILVIDASIGAFEAVIEIGGGQTREHAQLIRSFGADLLIVCVNKMDAVQYSKERFDAIKLQLGTFLQSCNYRDSSVLWVPLSAMENQILVGPATDSWLLSWYKGPSLLEAIDHALQPPAREYSKPLLMPICDVLKLTSQGQVSVCGKLDAGALRNGSKVGNYIHNMATFFSGLAIGFINCWQIALITLATGPFIVAAGGISNIFLHRLAENIPDAYAKAASVAEQAISYIRTLYAFTNETLAKYSYATSLQATLRYGILISLVQGLGLGFTYGLAICSCALQLYVGRFLVQHNKAHGGEIVTALFAIILSGLGLNQAATNFYSFEQGRIVAYRLYEMISRSSSTVDHDGNTLDFVQGNIEFRNRCSAMKLDGLMKRRTVLIP